VYTDKVSLILLQYKAMKVPLPTNTSEIKCMYETLISSVIITHN